MTDVPLNGSRNDDPRRLREMIQRASSYASLYDLTSVMVGMSGAEGDLLFPEMVDYVGSALRVDDGFEARLSHNGMDLGHLLIPWSDEIISLELRPVIQNANLDLWIQPA